jgi:hypothetical protein
LATKVKTIVNTMKNCFIKGKVRVTPVTAILTNDSTANLLPKEKIKYVSRWFSECYKAVKYFLNLISASIK